MLVVRRRRNAEFRLILRYHCNVSDALFFKIIGASWIVAFSMAVILVLFDYRDFNRMKTVGLTEISERIDELDGLLRDANVLDHALKLDSGLGQEHIDDFEIELGEWGERLSDYTSRFRGGKVRFYEDADTAVSQAERTLGGLRAKFASIGSLANNLLKNYEQAEYYRTQASLFEQRARQTGGLLNWGRQIDMYLQADGHNDTAKYYYDNARRIQVEISDRRSTISKDLAAERKHLNDARRLTQTAAQTTYLDFLGSRARNFDVYDTLIAGQSASK